MLIARQNGHIDPAPRMRKPEGPVKAKEIRRKLGLDLQRIAPDAHTCTRVSFTLMSQERSTKVCRPSMPNLINTSEGLC